MNAWFYNTNTSDFHLAWDTNEFSIRKIRIIWMSQCFPLLNNSNYHCTSGFALLKLQTDQPMFYTLCTVIRLSLWPNSFTISSISSTVTTDFVSKEFFKPKMLTYFLLCKNTVQSGFKVTTTIKKTQIRLKRT